MPYRVRVFCQSSEVPSLSQALDFTLKQGVELVPVKTNGPLDLMSPAWTQVELSYKEEKGPLVVECDRHDGSLGCLTRVEVQEFLEEVKELGSSPAAEQVTDHLTKTQFIVATQLLNDIDDDGYRANATFLDFFVRHCDGMVHADLEGFYHEGELLLELR